MKSKSNRFFTPNDLSKSTTFDKFVLHVASEKVIFEHVWRKQDVVMIWLRFEHTVVFLEPPFPLARDKEAQAKRLHAGHNNIKHS